MVSTTWTGKSTVYQKVLTLSNVLLLIFSTGLIFSSLVFLGVYHMAKVQPGLFSRVNYLPFSAGVLVLALLRCSPQERVQLINELILPPLMELDSQFDGTRILSFSILKFPIENPPHLFTQRHIVCFEWSSVLTA